MNPDDFAFVRCGSHRAREKLDRLVSVRFEFYPVFAGRRTTHISAIPAARLDDALKIRGVSKARWTADYSPCWNQPQEAMDLDKALRGAA